MREPQQRAADDGESADQRLAGPVCGTAVGSPHRAGCDVEQCTACGRQPLACLQTTGGCPGHDPQAAAWTREWPGAAECRRRGWYAVRVPGQGCVLVPPGTPGAIADPNRLAYLRATGRDELSEAALRQPPPDYPIRRYAVRGSAPWSASPGGRHVSQPSKYGGEQRLVRSTTRCLQRGPRRRLLNQQVAAGDQVV